MNKDIEEIDLEDYPFYYTSSSQNNTSKIPPLSYTINQKVMPSNKQLHTQLILISKYAQDLENQLNQKNKHFERLEYMVQYLTIAQQKRDEIISHIQEENRKLQQQIQTLTTQKQQEQLVKQQSSQLEIQQPSNRISTSQERQQSATKNKKREEQKKLRPKVKRDQQYDKNKTVLKIDIDTDVDWQYDQLEHVAIVKNLLVDDEQFIQKIKETDFLGMLSFFDGLDKLFCEHSNLFQIVFRLRKLLDVAISMTSTMALQETLECLVDHICICLESDRASVFIFDQETECLWSKVAKGSSKKITIPFNQGLVGHVFMTGEVLNIRNAYSDTRFNKNTDKQMNYKTNTILSVPIKDKDGNNIIGVLQAVNKLKGYFTQDDEAILQLISQLTSIVLRNSQQFDETISYHNNLRSILKTGIYLSQFLDIKDLIKMGVQKLKEFFSVNKANILIVNKEKNMLYTYDTRNFMKLVEFPLDLGIAGLTYQKGDTINVSNAYNNEQFNSRVDIDTHMPIISMPIKDSEQENKIIGILQIINSKGIQGFSSTNKAKINALDFEYLQFFGSQFAQSLQNAILYSKRLFQNEI